MDTVSQEWEFEFGPHFKERCPRSLTFFNQKVKISYGHSISRAGV